MHKYEIIIYWSNDDDAFVSEVPELPGCMAGLGTSCGPAFVSSLSMESKWPA